MRIGIVGYGNLGRGVETGLFHSPDMKAVAIFTRRDPQSVVSATDLPVLPYDRLWDMKDDIDVVILCGGSATDLPDMTPQVAQHFHVVDSFDNHGKIPQHFQRVDQAAKVGGRLAAISSGWDPGMFSLQRLYAGAILPNGTDCTFWGRGVSQGHSDAIRRLSGVVDARQYTIPVPQAVQRVLSGEMPNLTTREKHTRDCYVVAEAGANLVAIEQAIVTMPDYFADYDTTVSFVTAQELKENHSGLPHGGRVIRSGTTGLKGEHSHTIEYGLRLESNPEFTSSVLVATARAVGRLAQRGQTGCITLLDIPPSALSPLSGEELRGSLL